MTVPSAYTGPELQVYMLEQTGGLGAALALSMNDFYEAVTDTLLAYGVSDVANATDISKLRALAKVEAWRVAKAKAAGNHDYSAGDASYKLSQLMQQAERSLAMAEADAAIYGGAQYAVTVATLTYANDPYPLPSDEDSE